MKQLLTALIAICTASLTLVAHAHFLTPGAEQQQPILLKGGTLHTVSKGTQENTDLLFSQGKIVKIGKNLSDDNAKIIDVSGQHVYPGLMVLNTMMGITEINAVRATRDFDEVGNFNPEVQAHVAFNTDSELIPTVRSNGITHAQVTPIGSGILGRSSLMHLDGWNWEDALVQANVGLHVTWPQVSINTAWWEQRSVKQQKEDMAKQQKEFQDIFVKAKAYLKKHQANKNAAIDVRYQAMLPVLKGEQKLFIHAEDARQIEQAVYFAKKHKLQLVIVGGADAWRVKELLAEENIAVVLTSPFGLPNRRDEAYDSAFTNAAQLNEAGVKIAFGLQSAWGARDLPWALGQSISWGVPYDKALQFNTLNAAEIMGLDKQLGSLEVGKSASLVVSEGDLFDYISHKVQLMYIDGRKVNLDNRQKALYRKYQQKPESLEK